MTSSERAWSPAEWQEYVQLLLKHHHGHEHYQEVPDQHRGDLGIEGFTTSGCAYQCYATEGYVDAAESARRQNRKISVDIKKFIDNSVQLSELFGDVRISRWVLVVPQHLSKETVKHAAKKTEEVRALALAHVASDFRIMIQTDDGFAVAKAQLAESGRATVSVTALAPTASDVAQWRGVTANLRLVDVMRRKLRKLPVAEDLKALQELEDLFLASFLHGQVYMQKLQDSYPHIATKLSQLKRARERSLTITSRIDRQAGNETLSAEMREFRHELSERVPSILPEDAVLVIQEAVADWLMRCPLDFAAALDTDIPTTPAA